MIRGYNEFLNEELFNFDKILNFFKEKYKGLYWLYLGLFAQKKGWLKDPKTGKPKVEIFPYGLKNVHIEESDINEARVKLQAYDTSIDNVNFKELRYFLENKYDMRIEDPSEMYSSFIWGAPGIGKTDVVKQLAKDLSINLIIWHLATIEPSDFVGVPIVKDIKGVERTTFALPKIFPVENESDIGGLMFLDELNLADNLVLKASMQLCLDGKVYDYKVPDKWLIIAAGNRKEDVPAVTELSPALANRFAHFNLVTTVEDWTDWAISKKYMDPDVIAFINFNKDAFHYLDPDLNLSA